MSDARVEQPADKAAAPTPRGRELKRFLVGAAIVLLGLAAYLFVWPSPIDPVAYEPPPKPPLTGAPAPNDRLAAAEQLAVGQVDGPEDVEVDAAGRIFTGTADGKVMRVDPDGAISTLADTGGRPVGLCYAPDGNLIVADAVRGLLSISPAGQVTVLANGGGERAARVRRRCRRGARRHHLFFRCQQ